MGLPYPYFRMITGPNSCIGLWSFSPFLHRCRSSAGRLIHTIPWSSAIRHASCCQTIGPNDGAYENTPHRARQQRLRAGTYPGATNSAHMAATHEMDSGR
ncbi:MAG: hypothetical protein KatS3mg110_0327 [Pirellulaceae bacterium]|nr:MAG: hypothetical protein KatS3mg110_0327 [Pirellulaceae bacterium]